MNFDHHPCFNAGAHRTHGRVHLPVAPRCNVQCKFCNRKYDCVNESRPGVSSGILTPEQAMVYLEEVMARKKNIAVVGIAGPGDPFANPDETMNTLRLTRETYPDMLLCVATNGLNLLPYVDELADLKVSHVTVTVNAVDPAVTEHIYAWVRAGKRVLRAREGAEILLERQLAAIERLKARNMIVKINSIIIPGINDQHIPVVAEKMAGLGVDILNCVPYYPNAGAAFEHLPEPSKEMVNEIRDKSAVFIPQMRHCTRCRADAVGLLGEKPDADLMAAIQRCEKLPKALPKKAIRPADGADGDDDRPNVAVASMEGMLVNQHLGEAGKLLIYGRRDGLVTLLEARPTPPSGGGARRWESLADELADCSALLVSGVGESPKRVLTARGIDVVEMEGVIEDAVKAVFEGRSLKHLIKRQFKCGASCGGTGTGCG